MHNLYTAILWAMGGYGLVVLLIYLMQSQLLFFPSTDKFATPEYVGLAYQEIKLRTNDDLLLDGWFIPAANPRGVVLFFHGNAGNISHRLETLLVFHRLGLSTLIFDYRGYGASEGKMDEQGSYRDAAAAWHYLTVQRKVPSQNIIFYGRSLGGAIAIHLAGVHVPKALIIESSFTSIPDLAAEIYPYLPVRWLSRFRYDAREKLKTVKSPVLIIHSPEDEIIPFEHGRQLFRVANEPKIFLEIKGKHNDSHNLSSDSYLFGLNQFLNRFVDNNTY